MVDETEIFDHSGETGSVAEGRRQLETWLRHDEKRQIDTLQRFAKIDTANPPGDTREGVDFIESVLAEELSPVRRIQPMETMPNLLHAFDGDAGEGPHLILNGHVDVFPVGDLENWTRHPFSGDIVDGWLHGRGVVDMKCGTLASVFTHIYLHRLRRLMRGRLTLTIVSDEETGGKWGSDFLLREYGHEVLGDCVLNGEPSSVNTVRFGEKSVVWFKIVVRTTGGHSAYPHLSQSAVRVAHDLIGELLELEQCAVDTPDSVRRILSRAEVKTAIEQGLGQGASEIIDKTTLNIGTIAGGTKVNLLPDFCEFEVDARLPIGVDMSEFIAEVEEIAAHHPGVNVTIRNENLVDPNWCDPEGPMMSILRKNVEASIGVVPQPIVNLGATDCRFWRVRGIPAYVHGCSPHGMGAPNEAVKIEEYLHVLRVHALSAYDYLTVNDSPENAEV